MTSDDIKSAVMLAALGMGAFLAYQAYQKSKGLVDGIAGAADTVMGAVQDTAQAVSDTVAAGRTGHGHRVGDWHSGAQHP
ncbi:hypothetical protein BH10PSE16_BH10PSE16_43770 [soil metagenome]